jgi:hypothetical protein
MKCDEAAAFGYPRERSFGTAGQRPLAICDRRRVERRVTASLSGNAGATILFRKVRRCSHQ